MVTIGAASWPSKSFIPSASAGYSKSVRIWSADDVPPDLAKISNDDTKTERKKTISNYSVSLSLSYSQWSEKCNSGFEFWLWVHKTNVTHALSKWKPKLNRSKIKRMNQHNGIHMLVCLTTPKVCKAAAAANQQSSQTHMGVEGIKITKKSSTSNMMRCICAVLYKKNTKHTNNFK